MAKIAVDCDGVLADFNSGFIELVRRVFPGRLPRDYVPTTWDYNGLLTPQEMDRVWDEMKKQENWWLSLNPYMDNVGALATFMHTRTKMDVHIVTARTKGSGLTVAKQTSMWLNGCGVFSSINYLSVITGCESDEKAHIYQILGVEYSIDDKQETVEQCQRLEGHKAALLDRPWNQDAKVSWRVKSVQEFLDNVH